MGSDAILFYFWFNPVEFFFHPPMKDRTRCKGICRSQNNGRGFWSV